jgi:GNAT superfamily N-acetyltransferase
MTVSSSPFLVRPATAADAPAAAAVLRDSITKLCAADHRNDAATLAQWLADKTPERFLYWLSREDQYTIVAEDGAGTAGVGRLHRSGEVRLCYVRPGVQRRGVGTAILVALEARARTWGIARLVLGSTLGARAFYERHGFRSDGDPTPGFGVSRGYPYAKPLTPNGREPR